MSRLQIIGILLAAGYSRRMGVNKLALPLGSPNIGSLSLKAAIQSKLDHVLVVKKKEDSSDWIHSRLKEEDWKSRWTACTCENSQLGQAYSLKAGIEEAIKREADAVVILLGDQPFLTSKLINEMICTYRRTIELGGLPEYVAVEYDGLKRPPVLFSKSVFTKLLELNGDQGARQLIRNNRYAGITITGGDQKAFFDIDTKADYQKALKEGGMV
ncbi:nucleotidyltransferase family protein [Niallia oryzisoli]|uniref:Nucleotidyltransferase family protein n=1 Tax=Niallia oryzisoli TaxID=1737571 RepID=A0ABZ2C936_9BACI